MWKYAELVGRLKRELTGVSAAAELFPMLADDTRCTTLVALDRAEGCAPATWAM